MHFTTLQKSAYPWAICRVAIASVATVTLNNLCLMLKRLYILKSFQHAKIFISVTTAQTSQLVNQTKVMKKVQKTEKTSKSDANILSSHSVQRIQKIKKAPSHVIFCTLAAPFTKHVICRVYLPLHVPQLTSITVTINTHSSLMLKTFACIFSDTVSFCLQGLLQHWER